jgi:uncharacterized protein YfdQ (DUF2303 family)
MAPITPIEVPVELEALSVDGVAAALDYATEAATTTTHVELSAFAAQVTLVDRHKDRVTEVIDLESMLPTPRRALGTTDLHTPAGLVGWVNHVADDGALLLFADVHRLAVTAVLNPGTQAEPGWGDLRGQLAVRRHPSWAAWVGIDGKLLTQEDFAVFVQEHASDISNPTALDMLEIAETLSLNVGARVSSAVRLRDGQRHLVFDETIDATAGSDRELDIPAEIELGLPIFEGTDAIHVRARLLYRKAGTGVGFAVQLINRVDVERAAFEQLAADIATQLHVDAIDGAAPPTR